MSYLDKIHKKPVEYKISDNVDTKSEVDEAVENMHWRRKWQPTPLFLPGEFQGRGSLVGCRL